MKDSMNNASAYEQAEAYILNTPKFTKADGLKHTREMLGHLGNPSMKRKIIHVAGTNGKGSVCAYLNAMLCTGGQKVGLFTSPHLVSMCERIRINGEIVCQAEFTRAFEAIHAQVELVQRQQSTFEEPTFFEYLFLMAMLLFEWQQVDVIILETGLGGRLDATNVVTPAVSVITEIGLDHTAYLGDTVGQIAGEKAGIIKPGVPVVFWDKCPESTLVIVEKARQMQAKCLPVTKEVYTVEKSGHKNVDFLFRSSYYKKGTCVTMPIWAPYQYENLAVALCAYEIFTERPVDETVISGVRFVKWPCRFEEIMPDVIVDGAHNADGMRAFLDAVACDDTVGMRTILFGAMTDKDYETMLSMIQESGLFDRIILTGMKEVRAVRAYSYERLFAGRAKEQPRFFADPLEAFAYAKQFACDGNRLYIAGSLYLGGYIVKAVVS